VPRPLLAVLLGGGCLIIDVSPLDRARTAVWTFCYQISSVFSVSNSLFDPPAQLRFHYGRICLFSSRLPQRPWPRHNRALLCSSKVSSVRLGLGFRE